MQLLGTEIIDETDRYVDNLQTAKVNSALLTKSLPASLRAVLMLNVWKGPRRGGVPAPPGSVGDDASMSPGQHASRVTSDDNVGLLTPINAAVASRAASIVAGGLFVARNKDVRDAAQAIEEHLNKEPSVQGAMGVLRDAVNAFGGDAAASGSRAASKAASRSSSFFGGKVKAETKSSKAM